MVASVKIALLASAVLLVLHLVILVILDRFPCKVVSASTDVLLDKHGQVCSLSVLFVRLILSQFLEILVALVVLQINTPLNKALPVTLMALLVVK